MIPLLWNTLVDFFKDNGYETCFAHGAAEGFEVLKKERPDLITLDLDMEVKHVSELVTEALREEGKDPLT
jgi:CheY-like chemotaxis protein